MAVLIPDTYMLGPIALDKAWHSWLQAGGKEHLPQHLCEYFNHYGSLAYNTVARGRGAGAVFENWLYSQGIGVRQIRGVQYLEFTDEPAMTMFTLRYL